MSSIKLASTRPCISVTKVYVTASSPRHSTTKSSSSRHSIMESKHKKPVKTPFLNVILVHNHHSPLQIIIWDSFKQTTRAHFTRFVRHKESFILVVYLKFFVIRNKEQGDGVTSVQHMGGIRNCNVVHTNMSAFITSSIQFSSWCGF